MWTDDDAPEGQPESSAHGQSANGYVPDEVEWEPVVPEQSPLTPVFDEATRQRTAEIIARYPQSRSALLPLLHLVQSVEGYVSQDGIRYCAEVLELTTAEVSAVATFYTMYKRTPCGEHLVSVCTNTLCAALGGDDIYAALSRKLGVGHEETAGEPGTPGRSRWSTPSAWRPATWPRCCRSTTSTSTTRPSSRPRRWSRRCSAASGRCRPAAPRSRTSRPSSWSWPGSSRTSPVAVQGNSMATETLRGAQLAARARLGGTRDAGQAARPAGPAGEEVTR